MTNDTSRSNNFVASFQVEGLCQAIRALVLQGIDPGPAARQALRGLRDVFVAVGKGATIKLIPEVDDDSSPADLLVIAEVLRTTMIAFLTPEEAQEQRGHFGFHQSGNGSG